MSDSAGPKDLPSKAVVGSEKETDAVGIGSDASAVATIDVADDPRLVKPSKAGPAPSSEDGKGQGFDQLATSLRHAYESTLEEDVPDSILKLLRQLD